MEADFLAPSSRQVAPTFSIVAQLLALFSDKKACGFLSHNIKDDRITLTSGMLQRKGLTHTTVCVNVMSICR